MAVQKSLSLASTRPVPYGSVLVVINVRCLHGINANELKKIDGRSR